MATATVLDFASATLTNNNLGGFGLDSGDENMYFASVGVTADGAAFDLRITAEATMRSRPDSTRAAQVNPCGHAQMGAIEWHARRPVGRARRAAPRASEARLGRLGPGPASPRRCGAAGAAALVHRGSHAGACLCGPGGSK